MSCLNPGNFSRAVLFSRGETPPCEYLGSAGGFETNPPERQPPCEYGILLVHRRLLGDRLAGPPHRALLAMSIEPTVQLSSCTGCVRSPSGSHSASRRAACWCGLREAHLWLVSTAQLPLRTARACKPEAIRPHAWDFPSVCGGSPMHRQEGTAHLGWDV